MKRPPRRTNTEQSNWSDLMPSYVNLIHDENLADSNYLRTEGLQQTTIALIGNPESPILDVGCGDGWLFDRLGPVEGTECDIVEHAQRPGREFSLQDVRKFTFQDQSFSLIVASLLLMFVDDLDRACLELYRVARHPGRLIVSLTHPHFYRTGCVDETGNYVVETNLARRFEISDHYIADTVGPFKYYYRPLNDYVNALARAGWVISQMRDWFVDLDHYGTNVEKTSKKIRRTDKVPMYSFIECRKMAR